MMKGFESSLLLLLVTVVGGQSGDIYIKVNSNDVRNPIEHFWRSTGFCPPDPHQDAHKFDLSKDMIQNLAYIGAVPHRGIEQVRIHWLLDLVTVSGYSSDGSPIYNFKYLDELIQQLYINGLKPGFEIMGNPSNIFTDFENKTQVYMWRDFVKLIATRYIDMYSLDYVKTWNFETWNEPDCNDFDMNMTNQGFANYYDASSEGLKAASEELIFGGPGGGCGSFTFGGRHGNYEEYLLDHVVNGKNYFTGETGVRMDFISLHKKGNDESSLILLGEIVSMKEIGYKYPSLAKKPFYNDEADPMVGWSKDLTWRSGSIYGAMAVKVIAQHQNIFRANPNPVINYQLLSNDNGFLSYYPHQFTQRTLLARFQMNNTKPHYTTFVQKPIYAAMCMLSLLGDQQVHVDYGVIMGPLLNDSQQGSIATIHVPNDNTTSDSWQMSLLIYDSDDTKHGSSYGELLLDWYIDPPNPSQELMLVGYVVSDLANDPYGVWSGLYNKTDYPTPDQFDYIRLQERAPRFSMIPLPSGAQKVAIPPRFQILQPEAILLHICAKSDSPPEQVTGVRFINITVGQVLVVWSDDNIKTKCIYTYEVGFSTSIEGPFTRVNKVDTIATISVIAPHPKQGISGDDMVRGYYIVRAVDYWKRAGPDSKPQLYSP